MPARLLGFLICLLTLSGGSSITIAAKARTTAKVGIAAETGIAGIHQWERVGRKICIKGHWHYKTSTGLATRKQAKADAIKQWEEFTAWDYGWDWMSYKLAVGKAMKCRREGSPGKTWRCDVEARACKLRRRPKNRKK